LARLKPWPRRVIVAWVLFTIPVLTVNAVTLAFLAPRLLGAGVGSGRLQWQTLTAALDRSAYATALSALTGLVLLAAPVAGTGVVVFLLGRRALRGLVRSRNPLVIATVVAVLVAVVGLALPSWEDGFDAARQRFDTSTEQPAPTAPAPDPLGDRGSVDLTPPAVESPAMTPPPATEAPPATVAPPANRNAPPDCGPDSSRRADGRLLWMQELRCAA
jgi:hypothetical protein